ncbi:MauE/DoxX family redox-associated membrane protein [Actinokineospora sp. NBRC 105648]|uniref:MauE/DoxX family redox-associated membrane protein n=1 Tax=Actinokineospora sp. NBRC 105648 TaxID=3032206 RepID=UPI0024A21679|nr:MauE/DoxX family redox-associated membrane protein [Actinokineospora sp. NBRC 105648]GLZ37041.1 hypothetical protein Acsp05_06660 [Actinokineospora sp. NBRC 105648]
MAYSLLALRWCLCAVFLIAAVAKSRHFTAFLDSIVELRIVPSGIRRPTAVVAIAAELAVAGLLGWGPTARSGFIAALVLTAILTAVPASAMLRRQHVRCACFGAARTPLGWWQLARNLLLLAMAAVGAAIPAPGVALAAPGVLVALAAATVGTAVITLSDQVAELLAVR